jgi:release factor glutamine methyltransferase
LLAELGWQFLNQLSAPDAPLSTVLDFGTGSGCIAIALAVHCPTAQVCATDLSPEAVEVAERNAANHHVEDRIRFFNGAGFSPLPEGLRFDLIVSNPPYIASAEIESLQPEVRDHDPRQALDGGPDGLECFRLLALEGRSFLTPRGRLMVEFGDGQAAAVSTLFEQQNWIVESIQEDYSHRPRFLIARL